MVTLADKVVNASFPLAVIAGVILIAFLWITKDGTSFLADIFIVPTPVMHIGEVPITVEFAVTEEERKRGLSGREGLGDNEGLLFVFPEPGYYAMWMKDMKFPIDIIWISEDMRIVSINEGISPDTYPKTFRPTQPALYALETSALFAKAFNVTPGQTVRIPERSIDKE